MAHYLIYTENEITDLYILHKDDPDYLDLLDRYKDLIKQRKIERDRDEELCLLRGELETVESERNELQKRVDQLEAEATEYGRVAFLGA